ncbi:hypothetical protein [Deinococcus cellulosilyticus]|uniref:Uncharacterized protein n=1 Tax=Deinococcus cellulosilyticus (strain DSM 18568 / NBRC 106333 / KACC 11606 / 5516J-15) TaxID=1223518 RepID=A0A511N732_DEIC1|nr:hypothetical protein [Deinococcus cellulosilyticus]GEM48662.1 hypothetical protein DC3_42970 [Deinococcus cellulosilyticus NBRC 106333 = KACC 11606]
MKRIPRPEWLTPELEAQILALKAEHPNLGRYRIVGLGISHRKARVVLEWLSGQVQFDDAAAPAGAQITAEPGNTVRAPDPDPKRPEGFSEVKEADGKAWIHDAPYIYDAQTDTYYTFLRSANCTLKVPGEKHRAMKAAYSNWDGAPQTINQICVLYQIPRSWFIEYKARHGWTHDSDPFTNEEVLSKDVDGLVDDALLQKRLAIAQRFQAQSIEQDRKDANKYRQLETMVIQPLLDHLSSSVPKYEVPRLNLKPARKPYCLVIPPYDLHFGKGAWIDETGTHYSRDEAAKLLTEKTSELLDLASVHGRPDKVIFPVGSDFFNSDNYFGGTTKGTPQDNDGTAVRILTEGCELLANTADLVRQVCKDVEFLEVRGNHDYNSTISGLLYLRAWFRNTKGVTFQTHHRDRVYTVYGLNLMGFTHGDGAKIKELPALMAGEAREAWGRTLHRVWYTGHLHEEKSGNPGGVLWYQIPSLSGVDRWHDKKGYTLARRAMQAFMLDQEKGPRAVFTAPVLEGQPA